MIGKKIILKYFMFLLVTDTNALKKQDSSYILSKKYSMKPLLNKEIGVFEGFSRLDEKNC